MKKTIAILTIFLSTISFSDEFDLILSTGVASTLTAGFGLQLDLFPTNDLVIVADAGITPLLGDFVGGAIKLESDSGLRYGIFYKQFTTYDALWQEFFTDAIFDSWYDNDPDVDDAVYDIYGIAISKVFDPEAFVSPFIGIEVGYGEVRDKEKWEDSEGNWAIQYYDFRLGFAF